MSKNPERAFNEIHRAAQSFQTALMQIRGKYQDLPKIEVSITELDEQKGTDGAIAKLVIVIRAETAEHAYEHAKDLEDQGCVCTSSGEAEVTCDCSSSGDQH